MHFKLDILHTSFHMAINELCSGFSGYKTEHEAIATYLMKTPCLYVLII